MIHARLTEPAKWVLRHIQELPADGHILDLAAGNGRHSRLLLHQGFRVTSVDIDVSGLQDLQRQENCRVMELDLEAGNPWPFPAGSFNGLLVTNYLHRPLFPHLIDCLRPGGVVIYQTFTAGNEKYGRPRNPDFLLKRNELRHIFGPRFQIIEHAHVLDMQNGPALRQGICARKT